MARAWLNQGAAGIFVPTPALEKIDGGAHIALLLQQLRALTNSFPGERVLIADGAAQQQDVMLQGGLAKYAQLTASAPLGAAGKGGWCGADGGGLARTVDGRSRQHLRGYGASSGGL